MPPIPQTIDHRAARRPIPRQLQVRVFRRDRWLCRWCGHPVIFAPVMRYLQQFVRRAGFTGPLSYHDGHWRRDKAPLLDHLGAVIDHLEPHSRGGAAEEANFVTACNKCNTRKSAPASEFSRRSPLQRVRGKYGEPEQWDGFSRLFVALVEQAPEHATATEREWLRALKNGSD